MSALADALSAAQAKALGALQKAYVAGTIDYEEMREKMDAIGCGDDIDQDLLIIALDTLKTYGQTAPTPGYAEKRATATVTDAQRTLIEKLTAALPAAELTELAGMTRAQASELIDTLRAGTYDASKWAVPF